MIKDQPLKTPSVTEPWPLEHERTLRSIFRN